jgi:hypothetical protein
LNKDKTAMKILFNNKLVWVLMKEQKSKKIEKCDECKMHPVVIIFANIK